VSVLLGYYALSARATRLLAGKPASGTDKASR
jgi:hypothetical protein